jgi:hypothetical protein
MLPDLKVTAVTAPSTGTILDKITVSWTVTNVGDAPTGRNWSDSLFISKDQKLDLDYGGPGDLPLLRSSTPASNKPLAPGESYTLTGDFTIDSYFYRSFRYGGTEYTPTGNVYLLVATDREPPGSLDGRVPESNQDNNVLAVPITINVPEVDLVVSSITAPASFTAETPFTVSWVVTNQGSAAATADSWTDYVYLESAPGLPEVPFIQQNVEGEIFDQPPLAPGASYTLSATFTPPAGISPGNYSLVVETDGGDPRLFPYEAKDQPETNENNNKLKIPISTRAPGVDLVVSSITAPTRVAVNTSFNLSWSVANYGSVAADSAWIDDIYLSKDPILDYTDTYLSYHSTVGTPPLAAGVSYSVTQSLTLTSEFQAGSYYLLVATDGDKNYQVETNEENNVTAVAIDIVNKEPVKGLNLKGTNGQDTLKGGSDNDTLSGLSGNDSLIGGNNQDSLLGGQGRDVLLGGRGNDTLVGGSGNDTLTGGVGQDKFVYTQLSDRGDLITDFRVGQDKIVLTQLLTSLSIGASSVGFKDTVQGVSLTLDPDGLGPSGFKSFILVQGPGVTALSLSNSDSLVF